jgi:hypothetical protein
MKARTITAGAAPRRASAPPGGGAAPRRVSAPREVRTP